MMKAAHQLMHAEATSAPDKKSIMQAAPKRGRRSVSSEGGMAEAVCYYAVKVGEKRNGAEGSTASSLVLQKR